MRAACCARIGTEAPCGAPEHFDATATPTSRPLFPATRCLPLPSPSSVAASPLPAPARGDRRRAVPALPSTAPDAAKQIRPPLPRSPQRLLETPGTDRGVVAGEKHFGHPGTFMHFRPRVMRTVEQSRRKRILGGRLGVVQNAGTLAHDRIDQHQRRQLAAGNDEVSHRDLFVDLALQQPLVDPLVPPRQQHQSGRVCAGGEPSHPLVQERRARRRQVHRAGRPHSRPRAAPSAPRRAPSPAAPPASPSPVRRHRGGRRRSGNCPSRSRAGSTRPGATVRARAHAR